MRNAEWLLGTEDCDVRNAESSFGTSGGSDRGDDNRDDLVPFGEERGECVVIGDTGFSKEIKPVETFVGFFFDDAHFGDEVRR